MDKDQPGKVANAENAVPAETPEEGKKKIFGVWQCVWQIVFLYLALHGKFLFLSKVKMWTRENLRKTLTRTKCPKKVINTF